MTEPPIKLVYQGHFHTGGEIALPEEPSRRTYRQAAKRMAFRALTSGKLAAQLVHVFRVGPGIGPHQIVGGWLIADAEGNVTAHRGQYVGAGGPWNLASAIVAGSAYAVREPELTGYYRDRPDEYRNLVEQHAASRRCLEVRHQEAVDADDLYAVMQLRGEADFLPLLGAAIDDRTTQLVLHDWLAERDFPHVDELRSKRWNQGKWTEAQLLDLLSKPFTSTGRSFSGRTI
jgi:hypothetical protein